MCLMVQWKKVFNLDEMSEWNISSQVEELKMPVTFFQIHGGKKIMLCINL